LESITGLARSGPARIDLRDHFGQGAAMKIFAVGILAMVLVGCVIGGNTAKPAPPPQPVAAAYRVTVGKNDAPPDAVELGPIAGTHGGGCGNWGERGNFEGAMVQLRNVAAMRQANYVMLVSTVEPHFEPGCHNNEFTIRGVAYRIPASVAPQASPPPPSWQPGALQSTTAPVGTSACYPPCSPGYRCEGQSCVAMCNPACGAGQVCRQDRTCAPAPTLAPMIAPTTAPAPAPTTTPAPAPAPSPSPR
jgi:hypothetical protein